MVSVHDLKMSLCKNRLAIAMASTIGMPDNVQLKNLAWQASDQNSMQFICQALELKLASNLIVSYAN